MTTVTDVQMAYIQLSPRYYWCYPKARAASPHWIEDSLGNKFQTEILVFLDVLVDRIEGWFLAPARALSDAGDFVALQTALLQLELIQQLRDGETSKGREPAVWKEVLPRVFDLPLQDADLFYKNVRNKLVHHGFAWATYVQPDLARAVSRRGDVFEIDVKKVLDAVSVELRTFAAQVKADANGKLGDNFMRIWNLEWEAGLDPENPPAFEGASSHPAWEGCDATQQGDAADAPVPDFR